MRGNIGGVFLSSFSDIETVTVLSKQSSVSVGASAISDYRDDLANGVFQKLEIDEQVFAKAEELAVAHARQFQLRSLDIVHLATALRHGITAFGTFDKRLGTAAEALGLNVFRV